MKSLIRKSLILTGVLLSMVILLAGCSSSKLAGAFDQQTVKDTATKIVEDSSKGDFESIWNMFTKEMQDALSVDTLKQNIQTATGDAGEYKKIKSMEVVGQKNKKTNEDMAVAVLVAQYDKKNFTYTISFNTKMQIIGFYIK